MEAMHGRRHPGGWTRFPARFVARVLSQAPPSLV